MANSGPLSFELVGGKPYSRLTISGFSSSDDASRFLRNAWSGLMWNLMEVGISPKASLVAQAVVYATDPVKAGENFYRGFGAAFSGPVDAVIDGGFPAVYETGKSIRTITGGDATATGGFNCAIVLNKFMEGAMFAQSGDLVSDDKLKVAMELYGAYYTEASANSKFLTLIMALEAMTTGERRPEIVQKLFLGWEEQIRSLASESTDDAEGQAALDAVLKEILHKRDDSLRSQIRRLVKSTLNAAGDGDADAAAKLALRLYDHRSTLVHKGRLPDETLATALEDAKTLVHRVLRSVFMSKAGR